VSDLLKRMKSTVGMDAINGDHFERSIVLKQFIEASKRIAELEQELNNLSTALDKWMKSGFNGDVNGDPFPDDIELATAYKAIRKEIT
jgi:hypothetical protein